MQTAWFEHFQLDINEVPARDWRIALSYENKESPVWQLSVEQLELADVHSVLSRVWPLPQVGADVLNTMQPSGTLDHLQLQWRPEAVLAERLTFDSNLENVAFSAWHDVPAASGISGRISGDLLQGELRLASDTGFSYI